jgi:type II secretory pathway pseudopilin PulG
MWVLGKGYMADPERKNSGIHKWLTYITLFISGLTLAGDLVTVLYYFIDGQELTTGFLLKILSVLVISSALFLYYISDIRGKLTSSSRMIWRVVAVVIVVGSIVWGFAVLGSPRTQRLMKYDEQKVNDLTNIDNQIRNYTADNKTLPATLSDITTSQYYFDLPNDSQTNKPYEYKKVSATKYELCAEFNLASPDATQPNIYARPLGYTSWTHPAGHYCFTQTINPAQYPNPKLAPPIY